MRTAIAAALAVRARSQTAAAQDRFTLDGLSSSSSIIRIALLVFGGVAILVGAFTIFNTLSITVAQRSREFGLLRMVGASAARCSAPSCVEALAIGVLASRRRPRRRLRPRQGPDALFAAMGWTCRRRAPVFAARTIVVSLLVGTS